MDFIQLATWNTLLCEKLLMTQLRKKFPSFYGPRMFISVFTRTCPHVPVLSQINPYHKEFPYRNGMVLHFYQQQESSTTKTVHKVINKGLKTYVQSLHTGENFR